MRIRTLLDRRTQRQLLTYAAVGALCVVIDVAGFRLMIAWHAVGEVAAAASGLISMSVHFTLNKYLNFKNHVRPLRDQLGTYCAVVSVWWIVTLTVIAVLTRGFGAPPLFAKLVAVGLNFPFGYLGQRYLTFGSGIAAAIRRMQPGRAETADGGVPRS